MYFLVNFVGGIAQPDLCIVNSYLFLHQEHWDHNALQSLIFLTVTFIVRGMSRKEPVVSLRNYSKTFTIIFYLKKKMQEFLS